MKLYTETQVKELLETQRGNCYVAILSETKDEKIASLAITAPLPGGDDFDKYYGIDVTQLIHEDISDKELQRNFDNFKSSRKVAKKLHNSMVPSINKLIDKIINLKELIVSLSVQGLSTSEIVKKITKLEIKYIELKNQLDIHKSEIDRCDSLIEKYKVWNENKLFMHWKYLKLLKAMDQPWLDFKEQYVDTMI